MSRLNQLLPATFRGIEFFVRNEAQSSSGRKIVLHEYVNSPDRFIEDLGELSPTFSVDAFIHGQNYLELAARLESALNEGGFGELSLPTIGVFQVQALPWRKNASQQSVGEISYTLEFATGRPEAGPVAATRTVNDVYALGDEARQQIAQNTVFTAPNTAENIQVFASDMELLSLDIVDTTQSLVGTSNLESITNIVTEIDRNAGQLATDVARIPDLFVVDGEPGIWQLVSLGLTRSGFTQYQQAINSVLELTRIGAGAALTIDNAVRSLVGDDIPLWPETTFQRIQRNRNRRSLVNMNRVSALVVAYEVAANAEYTTRDEINATREEIEAAHDTIFFEATSDVNIVQSVPAVRDAIEDVRVAALDVIERKRQQTTSTVVIEKRAANSSFVEAHRQYAEDFLQSSGLEQRAQELRALNPTQRADALRGETTIFRT